jgi:hypothetical protein
VELEEVAEVLLNLLGASADLVGDGGEEDAILGVEGSNLDR